MTKNDSGALRHLSNGKLYKPLLLLLWSVVVFFAGGASQAARLRAHESNGHPVVAAQLEAIQGQLHEIKTDVREIRLVIGGD